MQTSEHRSLPDALNAAIHSYRHGVMSRLSFYASVIDEVKRIVDQRPLDLGQKLRAQYLLKQLKEHLSDDLARGESKRAQAKLTDWEREILIPTVRRVLRQLRIRWNSNPNSEWLLQLTEAQLHLSHTPPPTPPRTEIIR